MGEITGAIIYAADAASKQVKSTVNAIINGDPQVIEVLLDTIEKVVAIAHGVFNTISESIGKVLEALSLERYPNGLNRGIPESVEV